MTILSRLSLVVALAGVVACGPKKPTEPTAEETNPAVFFRAGVGTVQTPDKKTGAINYQKAYENFVRAAELNGGTHAHFNAGWVAEAMGRADLAAKHYRSAYVADKNYEKSMFSLAKVLKENGQAAKAVELYKDFLSSHPNNLDVRNDLVVALSKAKAFDEAQAEAQEILRQDPQNPQVYRSLSSIYFDQDKLGMSQLCNEKALALNEGDVGAYNNMGVTYLIQDDIERAIQRFKTAVKLDSKNFEANANLGFVALNSGDYQLALASFQSATETNPTSVDARIGLAVSLRGIGQLDQSGAIYDDIIKGDPKNQIAYYNAATLHEKYTKNFNKAEKYLQAYVDSHAGSIGPDHEVFQRMERIKKSREEREAYEREQERLRKEEEERKKRNQQLLANLENEANTLGARIQSMTNCIAEDNVQEGMMYVEMALEIFKMKDPDMVSEIKPLLDGFSSSLDEVAENCNPDGGSAAPSPTPGEAPPPEEGGEQPAEGGEQPAEGGGE
jgi:tetratricopeptide (TPR) repeat protein